MLDETALHPLRHLRTALEKFLRVGGPRHHVGTLLTNVTRVELALARLRPLLAEMELADEASDLRQELDPLLADLDRLIPAFHAKAAALGGVAS